MAFYLLHNYMDFIKKVFPLIMSIILMLPILSNTLSLAQLVTAANVDKELNQKENEEIEISHHELFQKDLGITRGAGIEPEYVSNIEGVEGAVYLKNREENWHGLDFSFKDAGMDIGYTYDITIQGFVSEDEEIPEGAEVALQSPDESYPLFTSNEFIAGEAFTLEHTYTWLDEEYESFRLQSNGEGAAVSFYVTEILIEWDPNQKPADAENGNDEATPAKQFTLIDFEDGELNGFEGRDGTETLTVTTDANTVPEDGKRSLHVSNRQETHQGPSLEVTEYINTGEKYEISVWVKNTSESSADLILSTQIGNDSPSYQNIKTETVSPEDEWVLLKGTQRYSSVGDGYVSIYVESSNKELEFYIDGVDFQEIESDPVKPDLELNSISDVYKDLFDIGSAVTPVDLVDPRLDLLKHHHNLVTAENAMKPEELVGSNKEFTFEGAKALAGQVYEQDLELHGHVLVWHSQSPDWHHTDENNESLSREEALTNMKNHIKTVMREFGPNIKSWDVVNEALDGDFQDPEDWESNLRDTGWKKAIGDDYLYEAFKYARKIADDMGRKDMVLYYNDYNDHVQPKAQTMYHMIKDLNEQWASENSGEERKLVSGVGMQGHYNINVNPENVKQSIERFEELDIDIAITELDITTRTSDEYVEEESIQQAQLYARLFQIFKEHSDSIDRVVFWGLNDSESWRSDRYPLLFDDQLQAKPAYYAVINPDKFLEEYPIDETGEIHKHSYGVYGTPEMNNEEIGDIWDKAPILNMNQMQQAHEVAATGNGRILWDEDNLYILFQVSDSNLDVSAEEAHEQDSVEAFINETGEKTYSYIDGVGQYRVNYENTQSFNPGSYSEGFESTANLTKSGYVVKMAIPWKEVIPETGHTIGFDMQINDAVDGARHGVVAWNDDKGSGWTDPSVFGELTLVETMDDVDDTIEKSKLEAVQKKASKLDKNNYTSDSWRELEKALNLSEDTQEEIDTKEKAIQKAIDQLEEKKLVKDPIEKAKLEAIQKKVSKLDKDNYTSDSWRELEKASNLPEDTQEEVDTKEKAIQKAIDQLEEKKSVKDPIGSKDSTDSQEPTDPEEDKLPQTGEAVNYLPPLGILLVGIGLLVAFPLKKLRE